mgnify:CR=1 FL=1
MIKSLIQSDKKLVARFVVSLLLCIVLTVTFFGVSAMAETADYTLDTDRQARLVRPLAFDLLNEEQTEYARKRLIQALENYHWRLGTGFLSTPMILDVLAEYDLDAAYRLLENEEMPGWQTETSTITNYADLPENAKKYIDRILELVGGQLGVLSVGPARETTLRINI